MDCLLYVTAQMKTWRRSSKAPLNPSTKVILQKGKEKWEGAIMKNKNGTPSVQQTGDCVTQLFMHDVVVDRSILNDKEMSEKKMNFQPEQWN